MPDEVKLLIGIIITCIIGYIMYQAGGTETVVYPTP